MNKITVGFIGLGLIGGSIAKALKRTRPDSITIAWCRNKEKLSEGLDTGVIDFSAENTSSSFSACDYIFLCTPVEYNSEFLLSLKENIKTDCIITDVGSVKGGIHNEIRKLSLEKNFIGGHPMAGSEKTGFKNSTPYLLENAYYAITPTPKTPSEKINDFSKLISDMGGIPILMDDSLHDFIVTGISHLPHLVAASLVTLVKENDNTDGLMKQIAAGGFKDITRIASSSPIMWEQICKQNKDNIIMFLEKFITNLEEIKEILDKNNFTEINQLFQESKEYRDSMDEKSYGPIKKSFAVYCDIPDETGAIRNILSLLADHSINIKNIGILHNREFEDGVLKIQFYNETDSSNASTILKNAGYYIFKR